MRIGRREFLGLLALAVTSPKLFAAAFKKKPSGLILTVNKGFLSYGPDAGIELTNILAKEITAEINREIVRTIYATSGKHRRLGVG